jgi:replicative DNA helicase
MTASLGTHEQDELLRSEGDEFHLACLLLSPTATDYVGEALEVVAPEDFYDHALGAIWRHARAVHARGERITRRTVMMEADTASLGETGPVIPPRQLLMWLERCIGEPVHPERVPGSIRAVTQTARLRRLVLAAEQIKHRAVKSEDYSQAYGWAVGLLSGLADAETPDHVLPFAELVDQFHATMASPRETSEVVPTPWDQVNDIFGGGLHAGRMYVIAGRPGAGKALAEDTPLPTPTGWTTMGAVRVGDQVYGADGQPTTVIAATDTMLDHVCYRVVFSDDSSIVADAEHLWFTDTDRSRKGRESPGVRTTQQIADTARFGSDQRANHSVPLAAPLAGRRQRLPVPPYALGVWLGDGATATGSVTLNRLDAEQIEANLSGEGIEHWRQPSCDRPGSVGVRLAGFTTSLRSVMVLGDKHIPFEYLRAPVAERRALLAGLVDTDGYCAVDGRGCELTLTCKRLASDAHELLISLGYRATMTESDAALNGRVVGRRWRIQFFPTVNPFWISRKGDRCRTSTPRTACRYITEVIPVPSVPVRCIRVDNADHLFLAGESMIPTHNSNGGLNIAAGAAEQGFHTLVVSAEMSSFEVTGRLLAAGGRAEYGEIAEYAMSAETDRRVREYGHTYRDMPLSVIDQPGMTVEKIASVARSMSKRGGLDLLVVDYLQLVEPSDNRSTRERVVAHISRALKLLAKELKCAVVAMAQLSRDNAKSGRRPQLADLRESGAIEQDCDAAVLLHHDRTPDDYPTGLVELIIAKNRFGRTGDVDLAWKGYQARIGD